MKKAELWDNIPQIDIGIMKRQIFTGENVMMVRNVVKPHSVVEAHKHPHEQMVYTISGEAVIEIDGEEISLTANSVAIVPSNAEHRVTVVGEEPFVVIDIFAPIREDFL